MGEVIILFYIQKIRGEHKRRGNELSSTNFGENEALVEVLNIHIFPDVPLYSQPNVRYLYWTFSKFCVMHFDFVLAK